MKIPVGQTSNCTNIRWYKNDKVLLIEFPDLISTVYRRKSGPQRELFGDVQTLRERKIVTKEKDLKPQIPVIIEYIQNERSKPKTLSEPLPDDYKRDHSEINQIFRMSLVTKKR